MHLKNLALIPAAALAGLALLPSSATDAAAPPRALEPDSYAIDAVHSTVLFRCEHLGVGQFWGRFNRIEGKLTYDEADPTASAIEISVDAASVDTNNGKRDDHLRNADFLSAKEFPTIRFRSTKVARKGDALEVTGDLLLHGVTKPVTAEVTHAARKEDQRGARVGFEARFTVDRTAHGMTYMSDGGLGNEVQMIVSLEATR